MVPRSSSAVGAPRTVYREWPIRPGPKVHRGYLLEMINGSGVIRDDQRRLLPATDDSGRVFSPHQEVYFVLEKVRTEDPRSEIAIARILAPVACVPFEPEDVKPGRIVECKNGVGVIKDLHGNILPFTDDTGRSYRRGENVSYVLEEVGESATTTLFARAWRP
jgi:hypothetical protein